MPYFLKASASLSFSSLYTEMVSEQSAAIFDGNPARLSADSQQQVNPLITLGPVDPRILSAIDLTVSFCCTEMRNHNPDLLFSFSGSIIKSTFVWGVSDIDILCIDNSWLTKRPKYIVDSIASYLSARCRLQHLGNHVALLPIHATSIDIVPSACCDGRLLLPDSNGETWIEAHPERFIEDLDQIDKSLNCIVRPAVRITKLFYAISSPEIHLPGHQVEMWTVTVARQAKSMTAPELFRSIVRAAPEISGQPLNDSSSQFAQVDFHLGDEVDPRRLNFVKELQSARRLLVHCNGMPTLT